MFGLLVACSNGQKENTDKPSNTPAASSNTQGNAEKEPSEPGSVYPIDTKETITSWEEVNDNLITFYANIADTPFGKQLEKETGVKVAYTHPASGQRKDQFNLMIVSNNLPDTIEIDWTTEYPGGPEKALNDKVIIPLNDLIENHAPNLKKILQENPELDKMLKTDNGEYYVFPMIRPDNGLVFRGPMIRKDWLDELKLEIPTTIDEWYVVLKAFKEQKGATAPLTAMYTNELNLQDAFIGAYNTANKHYVDDSGQVKYGPIDPQFKDALTLLNKWYEEGLFDKDFALNTETKNLTAKMLDNSSGATVHLNSGGIGGWTEAGRKLDPNFTLAAAPYPTLNKGEVAFIGQRSFEYNSPASKAISADAKNPELVAQWLDYAFSEAGSALFNFGIEGESYTMENGVPTFTDKITNDPTYSMNQLVSQYTKPNGPFLGDARKNFNIFPEQDDAIITWAKTDALKHTLPGFITPTVEESAEVAKILTAVKSYKEEMFVKFVMGRESLDKFDEYVSKIEDMGIDQVTTIYQNALERYNNR
ncbi:MAG TPA: extracellular solute-binding protein [Candidatus Paenibacillus intestinavium]|nr:extracellular solute-binding protein [Candidatus Paenibacillus intestinavium]